jgi:pyruvate,water dikinase
MSRTWAEFEFEESFDMAAGKAKAWFMDGVHTVPRWPALPLDHVWPLATRGLCWGTQKISHPQCKGWLFHSREGSAVLTPNMVTDEAEKEERKVEFQKQLVPFIEDFPGLWDKVKVKWEAVWDKMFAIDLASLRDIELEEVYRELVEYEVDVWKDHFFYMQGIASVNMLFEDLAQQVCGFDSASPVFTKLTSGFDSKAFDSDREMWNLGQKAIELGMGDLFKQYNGMELLEKAKAAPNSDEFFKGLEAFNKEYGQRLIQLLNFATETWAERPDVVLDKIATVMKKEGSFQKDDVMAKMQKERAEAEQEVLAKVPAEQKEWFTKLMKAAQHWNWWSEEHEFWLNEASYSMMRRVMLEFGKRFVKADCFDNVDDIFHIRQRDFERVIYFPENFNLRPEVACHRGELESFQNLQSIDIHCNEGMEAALGWLAPMREVHVALTMGKMPVPKEGVEASLWGSCGCPGTVEGVARVVMDESQLNEIQPGEIIIAPTTYVTWTPIFSIIAGLAVDRGGTLSHAAICSREYSLPCILNTFVGTQTIKTGQRVRLQADIGAIFVLD